MVHDWIEIRIKIIFSNLDTSVLDVDRRIIHFLDTLRNADVWGQILLPTRMGQTKYGDSLFAIWKHLEGGAGYLKD